MSKNHSNGPEISEEEFYLQRLTTVKKQLSENENVYPNKFEVKNRFHEIIKYKDSQDEELQDINVQSAGRIMSFRVHARYSFFQIMSEDFNLQLVVDSQVLDKKEVLTSIRRGDIVGFRGKLGRTKTKEFSVFVKTLEILTPCLRSIPTDYYGLKDPEIIYRKRYLDLLINKESKNRFMIRSKLVKFIRNYLDERDFVEVETPLLNIIPSGAAAKPFITHHNELKMDLYLRIAPELYLKKLVIGGMDRVYDMGKVFRNEGIDLTHNPEFTICEFYMAYADYNDMMNMTEELLNGMCRHLHGSEKITYAPNKREQEIEPVEINFARPFAKYNMLEEISKAVGKKLDGININEPETLKLLIETCEKNDIKVDNPKTLTRVLDKLVGHFIEPKCINPSFIVGYPLATSPLAKNHRSEPGMVERFELFINGKEICNAYTELNNPVEQRLRFKMQAQDINEGDDEAMITDEDFCVALEYGLPPTGGWGLGVDRLTMFMTNAANIKDVVLFPAMKPEAEN
ncbi:lysine-tRNA ligase (KARS1) [Vairimorpha necatrix]|uniref:Lysine--tRNA ligase n=1 Tax=Vairimorpha necatrix TaxID=6039 RepID=A0AAX4J930_9MICR